MKWRVLISAPYFLPVVEQYREFFQEHGIEPVSATVNERLGEDELLEYAGDVDGAICGDDRFSRRVLCQLPRLKVISKWGTGIDSIDQEAAAEFGVAVKNTPDAFTDAVADSVMAYVLCFARGTAHMDRQVKAGDWEKRPGVSLGETALGVVGVGNIGRAVVKRAKAFGMRTLGHDTVQIAQDFVAATGLEVVDRETVLRDADFLSLNCDLNPTSLHWLGSDELRLMKPNAVVINTARGPIVDEPSLVEALQSGLIGGAGLDVFEEEPLPSDSPLRELDNVLLAPHNANSSPRAWARVHENTLRNLIAGLEGHES